MGYEKRSTLEYRIVINKLRGVQSEDKRCKEGMDSMTMCMNSRNMKGEEDGWNKESV